MAFSPIEFLANLSGQNDPAKACLYEVLIPLPEYLVNIIGQAGILHPDMLRMQFLTLQCESAELPGKTLITADAKIYGPIYKVPYQTQYQESNFTFICTNTFYEKKLFETWLYAIMPTETNNLRFPKGKTSRYMTKITVNQFDPMGEIIFSADLIDAFPIGISPQPLSWSEDNFHRLTVQFFYQKYIPYV